MTNLENIFAYYMNVYYTYMKVCLKYRGKVMKYLFQGFVWEFLLLGFLTIASSLIIKINRTRIDTYLVLYLGELAFLFLSSLSSPGYCSEMEADEDGEESTLLTNSILPSTQRGEACKECGIQRPLRSCHCFECGRCIVRYDHHDLLINNCVGYKNQYYYVLFLVFGLIKNFYYLLVSVSSLYMLERLNFFVRLLVILLISEIVLESMCLLFQLRSFIPNIIENITLFERLNAFKIGYLKDESFKFFNPFDHGLSNNVAEFFHLTRNWMQIHYYCLMDIPNHPLRVKGLQYLQRKSNDPEKNAEIPAPK